MRKFLILSLLLTPVLHVPSSQTLSASEARPTPLLSNLIRSHGAFAITAATTATTVTISLSSLSDFNFQQGGSLPPAQSVKVGSEEGIGFTFSAASSANWISVSPGSGSGPGTLSVSVDPSGKAPGSYQGSVTVSAPDFASTPQSLPVVLNVSCSSSAAGCAGSGGAIAAPSSLTFYYQAFSSVPVPQQVITVGPVGPFTATTSVISSQQWLSTSANVLSGPASLTVSVNPKGLPAGATYQGSITITASSGTVTIPVSLTVTTSLVLEPDAGDIAISSTTAGPRALLLTASNNLSTPVAATTSTSWISVGRPTSASTPTSVPLSFNLSGLCNGLNVGSITLTAPTVANNIFSIPVVALVSGSTVTAGCGSNGLQIVSGNNQTAVAGTTFGQPLVVQVTNGSGPVSGAPVQWTVTSGTVILTAPSSTTDSNGRASTNVIAGPSVGSATVSASTTLNGTPLSVSFTVSVSLPTLSISSTASLPAATVGSPYSQSLTATGGQPPYTWSIVSGSVPGLTLSSSGVLSGTPTTAGTFPLSVRVQDSASNASTVVINLVVASGCTPSKLILIGNSLQPNFSLTAGQPISLQVAVADDCGPVNSATVGVTFSDADPLVTLAATGGGVYRGTWRPVATGSVQVQFNAFETIGSRTITGQTTVAGTVVSPVVSTVQPAPASLSLDVQSGGKPASATLAITSTGDPLTFTVSTNGGSWLAASPASATTPATVTVTVDPSKLTTPGSFNGSVVLAVGSALVLVPVKVNFTVSSPQLSLPLTPLSFTGASGGVAPPSQVVGVTASGGTVSFTATASTSSGGPWLAVSPPSAATDTTLTISVNQGNLSPGQYSGTVTVSAPSVNGGVFQIPIGLTVTAPLAVTSLLAIPSGLQFQHQINGNPPGPQALNISSSGSPLNFLATAQVSGNDPPWLLVSPRTGTTPAALSVSVQPGGLAAGNYSGSIVVAPNGLNAAAVTVPVQLSVSQQPAPTLVTQPSQLTYFAPSNGSAELSQVTVAGTGSQLLNFTVQTQTDVGSWLKASRSSAGASGAQSATIVVSADPTGLAAGTYSGRVTINGPAGPTVVPVAFTVGAAPRELVLSQTALTFTAAPSSPALPQDVAILATGQGSAGYTATAQSALNWLSVTPSSGQVSANGSQGDLKIQVSTALPPGEYHGQILIQSPDVDNSPLAINVVMLLVASANSLPQTVPTGLTFVAAANGANPAPQDVTLVIPGTKYDYNLSTVPDPANPPGTPSTFLTATKVSADAICTMRVGVSVAGLAPGVYRGTVSVVFPGNIQRSVSVLLLVTQPASVGLAAKARPRTDAPVCVPSQYLPLFTSLEQNFSVSQGAPATTELVIVDDCGNAVTDGSAGNTFSTGDRPLNMQPLGDGRWRATWVPRGDQGYTVVNVVATDPAQTVASGQAVPLNGLVQNSINAPVLSIVGAVTTLDGQPQLAVAPGSWIRISGTRLADSAQQATGQPQSQLGNTSVTLGGFPLLLQTVDTGSIVALVPANVPVNTMLPLVVANGSYLSAPESVLLAQSWPVVQSATMESSESGMSLVVELSGVGAMDGNRPRVPFRLEIGGKRVPVEVLTADPLRPSVYGMRVPMESKDWQGATLEVVGATARPSRRQLKVSR